MNIIVLSVTLLICLILFELFLRFAAPQPCYYYPRYLYVENDKNCFEFAKNVETTLDLPDFRMNIKTNSLGMRDYEPDLSKKVIFAVGDSFQYGFGVDLDDTYVKLLEKKMNGYTILNAAISGYGTKQELNYFRDKGLSLNPDILIVSMFIGNDLSDNLRDSCPYRIKKGYLVEKDVSWFRIFLNQLNTYCFIKKKMFSIPVLRNIFYNNFKLSTTELFAPEYTDAMQHAVSETRSGLYELGYIAEENKITPILLLIPDRLQVEVDKWNTIARENSLVDYDITKPNTIIKEFAEEQGFYVIDLLPEFQKAYNEGTQLYFETDNHMNKEGHALTAEILYSQLNNIKNNSKK